MRRAIVTFIMKLLFMNNYHVSKNPAKKVNREKKAEQEEPLQNEAGISEGGGISK
jgi:hypothetical protein